MSASIGEYPTFGISDVTREAKFGAVREIYMKHYHIAILVGCLSLRLVALNRLSKAIT